MYGQNSVMHWVFIHAGLEGITIISLAVLKFFSDLETFLQCGDYSVIRRALSVFGSYRA